MCWGGPDGTSASEHNVDFTADSKAEIQTAIGRWSGVASEETMCLAADPPRVRALFFSRSSGLSVNPSADSSDNKLKCSGPPTPPRAKAASFLPPDSGETSAWRSCRASVRLCKSFALSLSPQSISVQRRRIEGIFPIRSAEIRGCAHAAASVHSSLSSPFYLRLRSRCGTEVWRCAAVF